MTTTDRRLRQTQPEELPAPVADDLSATVLAEAIDTLAALRTPYWLGDTAVHLHTLASLLTQAQRLLPEAVAQARDQDLTWNEIGQLLGLSGSTTARRYRHATRAHTET
jgi:NAD dependent epimerase/dehydratase family enzyme